MSQPASVGRIVHFYSNALDSYGHNGQGAGPYAAIVGQTCGPDAGYANRGTFVIGRSGVVRFAERKEPGEARDQKVWTDALAALTV